MIRAILIAAAIVALARCSNAPPQASVFGASPTQTTSINLPPARINLPPATSSPTTVSSPPPARVVDVPGPIGVLGVVAAFGWSRQLRRRVKATQSLTTKP